MFELAKLLSVRVLYCVEIQLSSTQSVIKKLQIKEAVGFVYLVTLFRQDLPVLFSCADVKKIMN